MEDTSHNGVICRHLAWVRDSCTPCSYTNVKYALKINESSSFNACFSGFKTPIPHISFRSMGNANTMQQVSMIYSIIKKHTLCRHLKHHVVKHNFDGVSTKRSGWCKSTIFADAFPFFSLWYSDMLLFVQNTFPIMVKDWIYILQLHYAILTIWNLIWSFALLIHNNDNRQDDNFCYNAKEGPQWSQVTAHSQDDAACGVANRIWSITYVHTRVLVDVQLYDFQLSNVFFARDSYTSTLII